MKNYHKYFNPTFIIYSCILFIIVVLLENVVYIKSPPLIGPFIEESVRFIVILFGGPIFCVIYSFIFALLEFCYYMNVFLAEGRLGTAILLLRIICIAIHMIYCFIQVYSIHKYYHTTKKIRYIFFGFIAAFILHLLWNNILMVQYFM